MTFHAKTKTNKNLRRQEPTRKIMRQMMNHNKMKFRTTHGTSPLFESTEIRCVQRECRRLCEKSHPNEIPHRARHVSSSLAVRDGNSKGKHNNYTPREYKEMTHTEKGEKTSQT